MIIACPACATRYVVPDSAIGLEGRTVRCAKCKHSWFQEGPELAEPVVASGPARFAKDPVDSVRRSDPVPPPLTTPAQTRAEQSHAPPRRVDMAEERGWRAPEAEAAPAAWVDEDEALHEAESAADYDPSAFDAPAPPSASEWADEGASAGSGYDEVSQFEHEPPFRPRRNWVRWLTWGAGAFAVIALAAVVAMATLGTPSWLPIDKPLFGADPGLKVEFPASEQERRTLPNGAEFFGARVVIRNEARETKNVPPLLIVLRDARERVVYSWELVPPQRTLAPGEAMTINEAMTDVPKSAVYADIGWAPR